LKDRKKGGSKNLEGLITRGELGSGFAVAAIRAIWASCAGELQALRGNNVREKGLGKNGGE